MMSRCEIVEYKDATEEVKAIYDDTKKTFISGIKIDNELMEVQA
ncbi:hypothetical protein [Salibacter halophilus]|nr:hypothetical protein [Salibacter halophilus]